jgi:hypothetical protein
MMIIDPRVDAKRRVPMIFEDVEQGYDYLKWMRESE